MHIRVLEPGAICDRDLERAHTLVLEAFGDGFRSHDWLHALGGVHILATVGGELVGHAAVVQRTLRHADTSYSTGYVEAVAVRADQQRRGLGGVLMDAAEDLIRTRHQIGALNAIDSACAFYARRGWFPWHGATAADTPTGTIGTDSPDDRILLFAPEGGAGFSAAHPLICDWRDGDLW